MRPVITYGSPVWGAAATTHMKKIQVIQNKILRVMTNAPWHINYDEHGRHNTDKETTTQSSRLHDYRETSEGRARFPESSIFILEVRLSKQQDEDHERYTAQRYPTQSVTYPANTQAKEEAVPAANQDRI
ncbi:hypothetical protein TNCV_723491 [Trichonephila clavipes]|nr:hypothetical protein TNCV_723491 [Trichonephila clavipes]